MNRSNNHSSFRNPKVFNMPFEQPKKRPPKIWKPILILAIIGGLYYFLFQSTFFQIKNIIVDQNLPAAVNGYLEKYKGQNIFTLKSSRIHDDLLEKYPELTDLNVIRGIPDSIKVTSNERTPKLIWQSGSQSYLIDENGVAYKEIQDSGGLIVTKDNNHLPVKLNQQVASESFINFVNELKGKLHDNEFEVDHFEVNETTFQIDAATGNGLILKFDITRTVDSQIFELTTFWKDHSAEPKSYIDLRVEGKVFYK